MKCDKPCSRETHPQRTCAERPNCSFCPGKDSHLPKYCVRRTFKAKNINAVYDGDSDQSDDEYDQMVTIGENNGGRINTFGEHIENSKNEELSDSDSKLQHELVE